MYLDYLQFCTNIILDDQDDSDNSTNSLTRYKS